MPVAPGSNLSHYRIVEPIGDGGMGVVYSALDEHLERRVAIKVLPEGTLADDAARKRFRREALALSRLNHPNIAVIHDFDTQDGVDFLVMEQVPGQTLGALLAAGPLPERRVTHLGAQLAEGLHAAHARGVVHCDLKPDNLRLTPDGNLKILDFGLARLRRPGEGAFATHSVTRPQTAVGTLPYMAPEQLRGAAVDARTDVYGAGAVLYEMATGRPPFPESAQPQLISAILERPPQAPSTVSPRTSTELDRIVVKCLDKEPDNRYQSARELAVDLNRLRNSQSAPLAAPASRRRGRLAAWAGAAGVVVAGLVAVALMNWDRFYGDAAAARPRIRSVAVLPLENLSGDPSQQFFADGMTEALITDLSEIEGLRVISRTSVMSYKDSGKTLPAIASELDVDAVVEGSVLRSGERVRVTTKLIEADTDRLLWANRYDHRRSDVLDLQGEIAREIAQAIELKLSPELRVKLTSGRSVDPEAYDAYLTARFLLGDWKSSLTQGMAQLELAVERDPTYAPAWAWLSWCYWRAGIWDIMSAAEAGPRALEAAEKAVELDPSLGIAHAMFGSATFFFQWDWYGAEAHYQRAVELSPNDVDVLFQYISYLVTTGRFEEAIAQARRAVELDPLNKISRVVQIWVLSVARRYDEAIAAQERWVDWTEPLLGSPHHLAANYSAVGRHAEAIALCVDERLHDYICAYIYAEAGEREKARELIAEILRRVEQEGADPTLPVPAYAALDDLDAAFYWLERGIEFRSTYMVWIRVDPMLDAIRSDPRYDDLRRRVGIPAD